MILYIIILVWLTISFFCSLILKTDFSKIETIWILFIIFIFKIMSYLPSKVNVSLLFGILYFKPTRAAFVMILGILIINVIGGGTYELYKGITEWFFRSQLTLLMNNTDIPSKPTIFLANYPYSYVEYLVPCLLGNKVCQIIGHPGSKIISLIFSKKNIIEPGSGKGKFILLQDKIKEKMKEGYSVFCYIEKKYRNRKHKYTLSEISSAMFTIAKNIKCTITPICIDHIESNFGMICYDKKFRIKIGGTVFVKNVIKSKLKIKRFYEKYLKYKGIYNVYNKKKK